MVDITILDSKIIRTGEIVELLNLYSSYQGRLQSTAEIKLIGAEKSLFVNVDLFSIGFTLIG